MTAPTPPRTLLLDEAGLQRLAGLLAAHVRRGEAIALVGDLGAGKTTFARAAVRAALGDREAEVPSPTFSLSQEYDTPAGRLTHYDFYRLSDVAEVAELGLEEALAAGAALIEWPERAWALLPEDILEVRLDEVEGGARRRVALAGRGGWSRRLDRVLAICAFLVRAGWSEALPRPLPGDASARHYLRLTADDGRRALLMDAPRQPDGPPIRDGLPYSRIAHLAEDVKPFVAIARHLRRLGLSAPVVLESDLDVGLLLLEDLGDRVYGDEIAAGGCQLELWRAAVDALLVLHRAPAPPPLPIGNGEVHVVPPFDARAMEIEVELLADWYVPAVTGAPLPDVEREAFLAAWRHVLSALLSMPAVLALRDYHSPNLLVLADRPGAAGVGIIDFQDALLAPAAYDLVSLLQDARLDVPEAVEAELLAYYRAAAAATVGGFDPDAFDLAYRALGAQRNTKILGIFARLARRDGKPRYLRHIPRIWRYLERDLDHPALSSLRAWYDRVLPVGLRDRVPG